METTHWTEVPLWTQGELRTVPADDGIEWVARDDGPCYADQCAEARRALAEFLGTGAMTGWWFHPPSAPNAAACPAAYEIDWTGFCDAQADAADADD